MIVLTNSDKRAYTKEKLMKKLNSAVNNNNINAQVVYLKCLEIADNCNSDQLDIIARVGNGNPRRAPILRKRNHNPIVLKG